MSINNEVRTEPPQLGNGIQTVFPFTFKVFQTSEVVVVTTDATSGVETVLTETTDYTVTLNVNQDVSPGGFITMNVAPSATTSLTLTSDVANTQPVKITNLGGFFPKVINNALDRATIIVQQVLGKVDRSIKIPISDVGINTQLPAAMLRANTLFAFDNDGNPSVITAIDFGVELNPSLNTLKLNAATNQLLLDADGVNVGTVTMAALSASRSWTFPNASGTLVITSATQTLTNKTLDNTTTLTVFDSLFTLQDNGDATKQAKFELSALTTATTRTYTLPDVTGTLVVSSQLVQSTTAQIVAGTAGTYMQPPNFAPLLYGTKCYQTTGTSVANSAWTQLLFDTEEYDDGNWHSTSSNTGNIVTDFAGRVYINATYSPNQQFGAHYGVRIKKNGTVIGKQFNVINTGSVENFQISVSGDYVCAVNDIFTMEAYQSTGGAVTSATGAAATSFSLRRIK